MRFWPPGLVCVVAGPLPLMPPLAAPLLLLLKPGLPLGLRPLGPLLEGPLRELSLPLIELLCRPPNVC